MKKIIYIFISLCLLTACNETDNNQKSAKNLHLPQSIGQLNSLAVVIDNTLWEGFVGDTIRKYFASPLEGLPTEEPIFLLHQIPPQIFTDNTRNSRNVLIISQDSLNKSFVKENLYARPQKVGVIKGKTKRDISCEIQEHFAKMIEEFRDNDIKEAQSRFQKSLNKETALQEKLGFSLTMPSVYKIVKQENNFFWIERQIKGGTSNLIVYEMPINSIPKDNSRAETIVRMRDSIGERYIPGRKEGMYMITETSFAPSITDMKIKNRNAMESRGLWEMKNFFLGGPYLNYIIEDVPNNRLVVLEGFILAPRIEKRDYLFELEAIVKSIEFAK
ncbi:MULTISPECIES: DUF4837 family protein [Capnocytophaga]|uniref:DUF4837 domain-containing protein n=1 Tax=Capnocytophaga canis TaxID=1848903 RepID=A0A0B7HV22_9FLAO|nr:MULTISPECIES: DUF4837 family protein [Capnocytophaga]ATA73299.1 DUF4837 domain-containing protein [Capnocytophaga sp. H4358]ATA75448.1 DUF4837 domain-containing protein [Capnocytophaga sp. H2931]RIY38173.1 DUF4837 domain-containing protein [Capnocytophaga canis]CEN43556.1 conserved hypothetical protein [Capnocytophaga canis]CEN49716.1 conserved hypothetical protein [Capnocytophaga canis]